MKKRFWIATCLALTFCPLPDARGFMADDRPALPNYDKRTDTPARADLAPNAAQDQAAELLKSRVPDLKITKDKLLGTARFVSPERGFLTGPNGIGKGLSRNHLEAVPASDTNRVIKAFLNEHSALFGHDARALTSARVTRDFVTKHNGLRTVVWEQTQDDIPVFESLLVGHITRNGELVSLADHFVPEIDRAANAGTPNWKSLVKKPAVSAAKAITIAAANIGGQVEESSVAVAEEPQGDEKRQTLKADNLVGPAWAQLVWLPMNRDTLRLSWRVILSAAPQPERYTVLVDAETGEVLLRRSLTKHLKTETYNIYPSDSPSPFSPGWSTPSTNQPPLSNRVSIVLSGALDTNASPAGWIFDSDTNNATKGNNADAFLDRNFTEIPDVPRPNGGANRVFNFPLNLTRDPTNYSAASTVQLFYRANWYHDRLYQLGFTEAAGNYQMTNFDRGGFENDPLICLVQAGALFGFANNAFFSPAPDGISGLVAMFIFTYPTPDRDGSLDQEVVIHELTHGVSERLVGAGVGISALQTAGMGEGWSDFYPLCLLSEPTDNVSSNYCEGGYVTYQFAGLKENYYYGIRRYPYSTDMTKNPLTFKDIDPSQADLHFGIPISPIFGGGDASEVHAQGEVWCVTLREVWANLVTKLGWTNGNELTLQLVTDGMKLAPENPNFLEARDAILQADEIDTGGSQYTEIWTAFAKRGMGYLAASPTADTTIDVFESYDLPPDIMVGEPDGVLEVRVNPPSSTVFFAGDTNSFFVSVRDAMPVTNATIAATVNSTNLVFHDDGVPADVFATDGTYASKFIIPTGQSSLTIPVLVFAPDKQTSTNSVTYLIVPPPPNDHFTNATKVPGAGTNYFTSNKRATIETNEPPHSGDSAASSSLWWNFTSPTATNVLVETGGSDVITVLAVYTNTTLSTLQTVASAIGTSSRFGGRPGAFVNFDARAGVGYRIAVAGVNAQNVGPLRLIIKPGGRADTNLPIVTVTSPLSGTTVTTNRLFLTGNAIDPDPDPTGIRKITITVIPSPEFGEPVTTEADPVLSLDGPVSTNWTAKIALKLGISTVNVTSTDFAGNSSITVTLQVTYRSFEPVNDIFANAIVLTNNAGTNSINTLDATKEIGEPNHAANVGGKSAWWSFTAPADGALSISTTNSSFDTLLAVYTGTQVSALTALGSNDDAYDQSPNGFSALTQAVRSNQTYRIAVDGYDGVRGVVFLTYAFIPATIYTVTAGSTTGGLAAPMSADVVSNAATALTATADQYFEFVNWSGNLFAINNPFAFVVKSNMNLTANFRPISFSDDFESGDLLKLGWFTSGNAPWSVQPTNALQTNTVFAGSFAARTGTIGNNQTSSLLLTANFRAGAGSFSLKVSSEANFDFLRFFLDGILQQQWSGELGWQSYQFSVTSGTHTLEWRYAKDATGSGGSDAAFIDNVQLPLVIATDATTPAHLQMLRLYDDSLLLQVLGQTNQQYIIQGSADFTAWQNISTNIANGGVIYFADPGTATNQLRFYRAVVP